VDRRREIGRVVGIVRIVRIDRGDRRRGSDALDERDAIRPPGRFAS